MEIVIEFNPKCLYKSHYEKFDPPFDIPSSWEWVTIGELLVNRDAERVPISSSIRKKQVNKIYDYYGAAGVIDRVEDYIFNERLLLVGEDGANLLTRVKDNAFFAEGKYWVNNHAHILDCHIKGILDYVAIVINAYNLEPYITGSAQPKLSQDNLNKIPIPLPPLSEQTRILNAINSSLRSVSEIQGEQDLLLFLITQIKSKILELAMRGKLVQQDPADEPAADMLRRINPKAKIITDNPHYPLWCSTTLGDICEFERGITFPSDAKSFSSKKDYVACLRTANVHNEVDLTSLWYISKTYIKGNDAKLLRVGDILMSTANSKELVGRSVLIRELHEDMTFGGFVTVIRTSISPKYLHLFLKYKASTGEFSKIATQTTNIANLNTKILSFVEIPLPPLNEQKQIETKIEELYSILDKIETSLQA